LAFVRIDGRYYIERDVLRAFIDGHSHTTWPAPGDRR
jgi:hypothetical protein